MPYINFKKAAKLIPFFGSFAIFCGILKSVIYYKNFNISITDFLDISEVMTSFIGDIVFFAIMFTVYGVLFYLAEEEKTTMKIHNGVEKAMKEKSFFKRLKILICAYKIIPIVLIFPVVPIIMYLIKRIHFSDFINFQISFLSIFTIVVILFEVEKKHFMLSGNRFDPFFRQTVYLFLLIIIFTVGRSFSDIHEVKIHKKYSGTIIQINDSIVISDDQNYFIGKTKNYLFFFKSKLKETDVYPMDRIKMISFFKNDKEM